MSYTITYSGGTFSIADGTLNSTTSLALPGKNYSGYGVHVDQNQVSLMEHFATSTAGPANAIKGQIWFDSGSGGVIKYNTSPVKGSPTWIQVAATDANMNVSFGRITSNNITSGSSSTLGTLTGQWSLGSNSYFEIQKATTSTLGVVRVDGTSITVNPSGVISANVSGPGITYQISAASTTGGANFVLSGSGGSTDTVKFASGSNVTVAYTDANTITISSTGTSYVLPIASASVLGGIKVGSGLAIDGSGVLSATGGGGYVLPTASASVLGGIKVGSGLAIDGSGVLSATGGGGGGGTVTSVSGTGSVNGITLSGTVTSSGSLTLGGTLSNVSLSSQVTGTLPVANGGTGGTTAATAINNLLPSQTGNTGAVLTTDGTNVSWSAFSGSVTANGYSILPGGLMLQWGNSGGAPMTDGSPVNFPTSFSGTPFSIVGSDADGDNTFGAMNWTPAGFTLASSAFLLTFSWFAVGPGPIPGSPTGVTITPGPWIDNGSSGSSITVTASSTSATPVTYSWSYVNLTGSVLSWTPGATTATAVLNNYDSLSQIQITLTATNAVGSSSTSIVLTNPNYIPVPPEPGP